MSSPRRGSPRRGVRSSSFARFPKLRKLKARKPLYFVIAVVLIFVFVPSFFPGQNSSLARYLSSGGSFSSVPHLNLFVHVEPNQAFKDLEQRLRALEEVVYDGAAISLNVVFDTEVGSVDASKLAKKFSKTFDSLKWSHGPKRLLHSNSTYDEIFGNTAVPTENHGFIFFVHATESLPSQFYRFLNSFMELPEGKTSVAGVVFAGSEKASKEQTCAEVSARSSFLLYPTFWRNFLSEQRVGMPGDGQLDAIYSRILQYARVTQCNLLVAPSLIELEERALQAGGPSAGPVMAATLPACIHEEVFLARTDEQLRRLLRMVSKQNQVVVATSNKGMASLMYNFICYMRKVRVSHLVMYALEESMASELALAGIPVYTKKEMSLDEKSRNRWRWYGTVQYQQVILERTKFIQQVLGIGYDLLLVDVDAVWLKDPQPLLATSGDKAKPDYYDIAGQLDRDGQLCGGFMMLRNTAITRELWTLVAEEHEIMVANATAAGKLKDPKRDSEQTILENLMKAKRFPDLRVRALDAILFPNGDAYFDKKQPQTLGVVPIVIHNNYIKGVPKKITRFKDNKLWALDKDDKTCSAAFLASKPAL